MQKLIFIVMAILAIGQVAFPEIQKQVDEYRKKFPKAEPEPEFEEIEEIEPTPLRPVSVQ